MTFHRLFPLALLLLPVIARAQDIPASTGATQGAMFPFVLPPFDDTQTATDMSWMNDSPAGKNGYVRTQGEHFVDGEGKPLRLWGVNLNFNGVFPPKEQAPGVAARIAKFGFNAVRLHHFDGNASPNGLWQAFGPGLNKLKLPREFDPDQVDRFDFFVAELIKRGIYVDINLHVGRKVSTEEGFARANFLPDKDKGVNYFDEKLIAAQQDFTRQLLLHVNPYTKRSYANEPGVCAVEMTNENSLVGMWLDGSFSKIPEPYSIALRDAWNKWLKARYDDNSLRAAWTELDDPLDPTDIFGMPYPAGIVNPNAPDARMDIGMRALRRFKFKADSGAQADIDVDPLGGPTANGFVRPGISILLKSLGNEKWGFQLNRDGLDLLDAQPYTLSFWARADAPRRISVNLWQDRMPFNFLGFTGYADVTTDWQQYTFVFRPSQPEAGHTRLNFNFQNALGTVQLAEVTIQPGGRLATPSNWTLAAGVPLVDLRTTQVWSARRDFAQFLGEIETAYVARMRKFLKEEIGVKCPIWTSQAQFGGWGGLWREQTGDVVDVHAYWKHPVFEGTAFASIGKVENVSMTTAPATDPLSGFSYFRLKDKPFVMSEWNSGQPNDFGQESLLMAAAYAAWQDWAGIFLFDYHSYGEYDRNFMRGYFSIDSHPAKMATAPAAAMIFRRPNKPAPEEENSPPLGDAVTATRETTLTFPPDMLWLEVARSAGQPTPALVLPTWRGAGASRSAALTGKVYTRFAQAPFATVDRADADTRNLWLSDTREVKWSKFPPLFTLNAARSKMAVGYLGGYQLSLGELKVTATAGGNNFETVALSSLDGADIPNSKRLLLTATGKAENTGMIWNAQRNSVGTNWGTAPTLVEGITASIEILTEAKRARVYVLGPAGERVAEWNNVLSRNKLQFSISPLAKTVWYEIVLD